MKKNLNLKRGLDLPLAGAIEPGQGAPATAVTSSVAVCPDDYPGFTPKLEVAEGDTVAKGAAVLHDKTDPSIKLVSPVSGVVKAVIRGARRKIERIVIEPAATGLPDVIHQIDKTDAQSIRMTLMHSGLWAMVRRRPYDTIAMTDDVPRDIFVTAFDSAPLAPSLESQVEGMDDRLAAGVEALKMLTTGHVYISTRPDTTLGDIPGADMVSVKGPHPAGNPGIQAANIAPVSKGEVIWTLDVVTLARIGSLILHGAYPTDVTVAITGSEVLKPCLVRTIIGADMAGLLDGNLATGDGEKRVISGNVLHGARSSATDGYLRFPYRQVTVIPEGNHAEEFMGWASMSPKKYSFYPCFPGHFLHRLFKPDARLHGGRRAMIMSGEYDRVLPMDILTEYLLKAIIARDIERMEQLGIYEVAPEDFALCEYIDASKLEIQHLVREGLEYMRREA